MNSVLSLVLALAAPAESPEWAPIAITDSDSPTLLFVDRTSIKATADGSSARTYLVMADAALRLHVEYDCGDARYRYLDSALPADAAPGSPRRHALGSGQAGDSDESGDEICLLGRQDRLRLRRPGHQIPLAGGVRSRVHGAPRGEAEMS